MYDANYGLKTRNGDICERVVTNLIVSQSQWRFVNTIISYLGVKSWDLQVCDRASTITHVDREKKNSAYYNNKMFYFFLG